MLFPAVLFALLLAQSPSHQSGPPSARTDAAQAPAKQAQGKPEPHIPEEVDKWARGAEQQDIPWKISVQKPILTFQQRQVVKVTADIDSTVLQKNEVHRDLLFVIKVADETGKWFPGENFVEQELTARLDKGTKVEMESEVLLRPGNYRIATIMYDSVLHQHNVGFSNVEVSDLKNDALPHLLDPVDRVEFIRGSDLPGANAFSSQRANLPLANRRPIEFDLLVDLSSREPQPAFVRPVDIFRQPHSRSKRPDDKSYVDRLIQSASVLSDLAPSTGCVRISAFDAIKKRVELEPTLRESMDWPALREKVLGPDLETISINALAGRKDVPRFILQQFAKLVTQPACKPAGTAKPLHVIVLLSHGLSFPDGSQKIKAEDCGCTFFYLRQQDVFVVGDDLKSMMSPLTPRILGFDDPNQFRRKLADLLHDLQNLAQ